MVTDSCRDCDGAPHRVKKCLRCKGTGQEPLSPVALRKVQNNAIQTISKIKGCTVAYSDSAERCIVKIPGMHSPEVLTERQVRVGAKGHLEVRMGLLYFVPLSE